MSQQNAHLCHTIRSLEDTIRGLTALKVFRLRQAILAEPFGIKKISKIGFLFLGMLMPERVRNRLRPATIALKKRIGLIPTEKIQAPPAPVLPVNVQQKSWPKNKPLLSVIIPCFNYGRFIQEALDSVLQQTFQKHRI